MNLFKGMQEKLNLVKFSLSGDADGGEKKHTDMFHREQIRKNCENMEIYTG